MRTRLCERAHVSLPAWASRTWLTGPMRKAVELMDRMLPNVYVTAKCVASKFHTNMLDMSEQAMPRPAQMKKPVRRCRHVSVIASSICSSSVGSSSSCARARQCVTPKAAPLEPRQRAPALRTLMPTATWARSSQPRAMAPAARVAPAPPPSVYGFL